MADAKISELPAIAEVSPGDLLIAVVDPSGSPVTSKATVSQLTRVGASYLFGHANIAANATNQFSLAGTSGSSTIMSYSTTWLQGIKAPSAGYFAGMQVMISGAVAAGTGSVRFTKNGSVFGSAALAPALSSSNIQYSAGMQTADRDSFAAGDTLGIALVTSADFSPTTLEGAALLFVVYTP